MAFKEQVVLYEQQDTFYGAHKFLRKFLSNLRSETHPVMFGSAMMLVRNSSAFEMHTKDPHKGFEDSDIDVAIPADEQLLERLFEEVPSVTLKLGEKSYKDEFRVMRVYETTLGDLFDSPLGKRISERLSKDMFLSKDLTKKVLADRSRQVDFVVVEDTDRVERVWDNLNPEIFVKYYWKKGPNYIGKEDVKKIFNSLDSLARRPKTRIYGENPVGEWIAAAPEPGEGLAAGAVVWEVNWEEAPQPMAAPWQEQEQVEWPPFDAPPPQNNNF